MIMELVEGAPLGEHFNSLKEKRARFSEERIWHIFIQVNFSVQVPFRPFLSSSFLFLKCHFIYLFFPWAWQLLISSVVLADMFIRAKKLLAFF